jgi:hypothetical protein
VNKEEEKQKIETDPDYIYCPSSENSLEKFISKHPDGVNDDKAAQVLLITPDQLRSHYDQAVKLIREDMGVENEEI